MSYASVVSPVPLRPEASALTCAIVRSRLGPSHAIAPVVSGLYYTSYYSRGCNMGGGCRRAPVPCGTPAVRYATEMIRPCRGPVGAWN
jgi:hypothetical protein